MFNNINSLILSRDPVLKQQQSISIRGKCGSPQKSKTKVFSVSGVSTATSTSMKHTRVRGEEIHLIHRKFFKMWPLLSTAGNDIFLTGNAKSSPPSTKVPLAPFCGLSAHSPVKDDSGNKDWEPVLDESSGLTYWWNLSSGQTTAVGCLPPSLLAVSSNSSPDSRSTGIKRQMSYSSTGKFQNSKSYVSYDQCRLTYVRIANGSIVYFSKKLPVFIDVLGNGIDFVPTMRVIASNIGCFKVVYADDFICDRILKGANIRNLEEIVSNSDTDDFKANDKIVFQSKSRSMPCAIGTIIVSESSKGLNKIWKTIHHIGM